MDNLKPNNFVKILKYDFFLFIRNFQKLRNKLCENGKTNNLKYESNLLL